MEAYLEYLKPILFFGGVGSVLAWIARSAGFFQVPTPSRGAPAPIQLKHLLSVFAIYLSVTSIASPLVSWLIESFYTSFFGELPPDALLGWAQVGLLSVILILFYLYCKGRDPLLFQRICRYGPQKGLRGVVSDLSMGVLTYLIGFPFVIVVGQIVDWMLEARLGIESYEQVAVRYLKTATETPGLLAAALVIILLLAPCIEEFLFRGCLQTFLRRHMGRKESIFLSSLCFSLFHFSLSQGWGNVSLCASLFVFALFLGFIYERQASLVSSTALHMTFNAVSTARILFFPESS
jgi:membrane protease YdiL (CAAX protease family)